MIVLSIRPEDDGGFFCSAQNPAGTARANFTVRVVESFEETGSAGTSGGLQENTDLYDPEEDDMFKVNTIIFFFLNSLENFREENNYNFTDTVLNIVILKFYGFPF